MWTSSQTWSETSALIKLLAEQMAFDWVGERIGHAPWVSAASYLFITGTRLGLTSVLFLLSHLAQEGCPRRDTVLPFSPSYPLLIFLE